MAGELGTLRLSGESGSKFAKGPASRSWSYVTPLNWRAGDPLIVSIALEYVGSTSWRIGELRSSRRLRNVSFGRYGHFSRAHTAPTAQTLHSTRGRYSALSPLSLLRARERRLLPFTAGRSPVCRRDPPLRRGGRGEKVGSIQLICIELIVVRHASFTLRQTPWPSTGADAARVVSGRRSTLTVIDGAPSSTGGVQA
jgi:hypothetical protein